MSEEAKAIQEVGKALQEMSKTASEYRGSLEKLGRYIAGAAGTVLEETGGILADYLKYRRMKNAIRFQGNIDTLLKDRGIVRTRPLPLGTAYPLLEAATVEEDTDLSIMFANLFVSYIDADKSVFLPKMFIDTMSKLSPYEARVLKALNDAPTEVRGENGIATAGLPESYLPPWVIGREPPSEPSHDLGLALGSLQRLGCIEGVSTWGGISLREVKITDYGRAFLDACGITDQ